MAHLAEWGAQRRGGAHEMGIEPNNEGDLKPRSMHAESAGMRRIESLIRSSRKNVSRAERTAEESTRRHDLERPEGKLS